MRMFVLPPKFQMMIHDRTKEHLKVIDHLKVIGHAMVQANSRYNMTCGGHAGYC